MATEGFLMSEEYLVLIEDLRSRVDELENGVAEPPPESLEDSKFFVRLTTLGDLTVFAPDPFPDVLVPYIAEIVVWNRVTAVADYKWIATGDTLNPDIPESETNAQEYVYAANGSQALVGTVFSMERRVAQSAGADIEYWVIVESPSGGGARPYIVTPNDTHAFGAILERPNGAVVEAFTTEQEFFIATPWSTRVAISGTVVVSPIGFGFFADVVDGAYYWSIDSFSIVPQTAYPASGNITDYHLRLARSPDSLLLGDSANVGEIPLGAEAQVRLFDNTLASSDSKGYFNGKPFECSYDSLNNLFLLDYSVFE